MRARLDNLVPEKIWSLHAFGASSHLHHTHVGRRRGVVVDVEVPAIETRPDDSFSGMGASEGEDAARRHRKRSVPGSC